MALGPSTLLAQGAATAGTDSTTRRPAMDDHMMGPWKEMNAFHRVMAAAWHPASGKNDLAPLRARGKDLLSSAEAWAASTAPSQPASCGTDAVKAAVSRVAAESKALSALLDANADDSRLKAALKVVHDAFEVAEKSCGGHG